MLVEVCSLAALAWSFAALSWVERYGGVGAGCALLGLMLLGISRLP